MQNLKTIRAGVLDIAYRDIGGGAAAPMILLHGFPYDIHSFDVVAQRLAASGHRVIIPFLRGYGGTGFVAADTPRSGEQAALAADLLTLMDALSLPEAVLGGYDWGGRAACIVAALWPDRVRGLVTCGSGYNIQNIPASIHPAEPEEECRLWYQYYLHSERGREGLAANRAGLARLLWKQWSPSWNFDDATFLRTARSFDNPDYVDVVVHSYRHRFGLVAGDPAYGDIERRLEAQPDIGVPAIILQGADDGVDPPKRADSTLDHFTALKARRILPGVGHNPPQEAPGLFAEAMLALA